jgi:hypothetical protein
MNWVEQVVAEFGRRIGIPQLAFDHDGALRLDTGDLSSISLFYKPSEAASDVIIYRTTPANYLTAQQYRHALKLAHYRFARRWPLQIAYDQRELIVAFRIPERSFMLSDMEKALDDLGEISNQVSNTL